MRSLFCPVRVYTSLHFLSILLVKLGFWLWFLFFQHCFDLMSSEKTYKESRYKKHTSREVCVKKRMPFIKKYFIQFIYEERSGAVIKLTLLV